MLSDCCGAEVQKNSYATRATRPKHPANAKNQERKLEWHHSHFVCQECHEPCIEKKNNL